MTTAVIQTLEHKVTSCQLFNDEAAAEAVFTDIVEDFGVEPNDAMFDPDTGEAYFDDGDYTVQMMPVEWGNPKGFN